MSHFNNNNNKFHDDLNYILLENTIKMRVCIQLKAFVFLPTPFLFVKLCLT